MQWNVDILSRSLLQSLLHSFTKSIRTQSLPPARNLEPLQPVCCPHLALRPLNALNFEKLSFRRSFNSIGLGDLRRVNWTIYVREEDSTRSMRLFVSYSSCAFPFELRFQFLDVYSKAYPLLLRVTVEMVGYSNEHLSIAGSMCEPILFVRLREIGIFFCRAVPLTLFNLTVKFKHHQHHRQYHHLRRHHYRHHYRHRDHHLC
mmetsp:Transcript_3181/g.4607  ORF Transcript_3181/g.4607 Transcript_3181/m.4607 type:complete len:203 (+) Transcript_3181:265-873(+)